MKIDTKTRKFRLQQFLEDLDVCIGQKKRFPFSHKINSHKITWSKNSLKIRGLMFETNIIKPHGVLSCTYEYTQKGSSLSYEEMTQILLNKIEEKQMSDKTSNKEVNTFYSKEEQEEIEEEIFEEEQQEKFEEELSSQSLEEVETLNFDEIEWAVIKLGLKKVIDTEVKYAFVAAKIIEKIES